ncbi:MAG TPA: hypothetical protein VGG19_10200 [Tepidisphaeraceae bacterium]|jgi:hypothetical protein
MALERNISIWQEADMIERFARGYRAKFATLIEQLNGATVQGQITDLQCLRLCVEAVDVMLDNQSRLADALKRLESQNPPMKSVA